MPDEYENGSLEGGEIENENVGASTSTRTTPTAPSVAGTTLGVIVSFAWEETAGTMPKNNYEIIYDCKRSIALGGSQDTFESTVLTATQRKTYVGGLTDTSDTNLLCNFTDAVVDLHDEWLNAEHEGYVKEGKRLWICTEIPSVGRRYFTPTNPALRSIDALESNTLPDYTINLTVQGDDVVWERHTGTGVMKANQYEDHNQASFNDFYKNPNGLTAYQKLATS